MSTVDKMLIKGIRSFSPENTLVITFFRPLTLIVGPNGAGKTTIIECLKHACTGEMPPNARSGHSFIHDPKVAGETETKAQIKLRFKTAAGKDVVCIRSFQLTQKASKMEYKAIESVLQTINPHTGEVAETRFASHTIVLRRLVKVKEALKHMVISAQWGIWKNSNIERAINVRRMILDEDWWGLVNYVLEITDPIMAMLCFADSDQPCLGDIYDSMDSMLKKIKMAIQRRENDPEDTLYKKVEKIVHNRWNKMTTPLHLLAYALSPRYYSVEVLNLPGRVPPFRDAEVANGYKKTLAKIFQDPEIGAIVRSEFAAFNSGEDFLPIAIVDRSRMGAIKWWYLHGQAFMYLQPLAIKVLSQKVCLSYRCADMDREVPALMGVSKAILENVIFVHQDDANWPLAEASILKKKFDDIFSATRYTKALEVIKKLHKEKAQEIKMYKLKLENLQTLKDAAYKLRQSIEQDQDKVTSVKNQIQDLEKNIQNIQTKIDQTEVTLKDLRKLQDEVRMKDTKRSTLFKLQQTQYAALAEENEDTDEELREWQVKFEERISHLKSKISKLERELNDTSTESDILTETINDTFREMGKLQAQADAHISVKHERDKYIQAMFAKHNLGVVDNLPLNNELAFNLTNRAKQRLKELLKDSAAKKESNDMEIKSIWKAFESVSKRCSEFEGQKFAKQQKKEEITNRLKEIDQELENPRKSDTDLARIDEKERLLEEDVQRKTSQLDERDFESDIQEKINERYRLEKNIKALQREKDGMASESEDRIKLGLKKDEMESFKRKMTKIIDDNKERIKATLKGRLPNAKELKKEINSALSVHKMEYDDLLAKSVEAEKDLQLVDMKIKEAGNNLVKYQRDREGRRRFFETKLLSLVQSSTEIDGFPVVLEDALEKRNIRKSQHDIADGMRRMFDPFERVARANHVCPCCERPFTPEEEDDFVRKQRTKSSSSAERVRELAMHSSNADAHFQQLDKLRSVYDEYVKLGKELIPSCEKLLDELSEDRERKLQTHDDLLGLLAQAKSEKESVERLLQPVENIDRIWLEMQNVQKQVEDLEYKLDVRSQGLRSMEEVNSELASLEDKRESLQRQLEKVRDDQKHMTDDLLALKLRWHGAREEKLHACNELTRIKHLREEQEKLEDQKVQTELDEQVLVEGFFPLSKEKEKLRKDYDTTKDKFELENEESSKLLGIFQQDVDMLFSYSSKIKAYLDSRNEERLKELQEKLSLCESQQRQCKKRKSDIEAELNRSQELLRSQDQVKRNIDDNIAYRKTKADVDDLAQEMEGLDDKIASIGEPSAVEADLKRYFQEKEKLLSELNRYQGTIGVYQSNISKNKLDLKHAQYKDIDRRYCDQLIELKTTEMANKDLDKYYNALDKALMRFHSMKMEEINKIIKELWQQTYRGQDIDYISIRSDAEGAGTRSYSYRVVMQSGDAELEMRGRCSAGQKVLASLIIRLALAETFCLNCGILALDEPTTNLDAPNAESLAAALLRIMEDRKSQENFQLIVITHDERFAQLIGQRQHAERYFRISKDEHQHSIIEAQEIFE